MIGAVLFIPISVFKRRRSAAKKLAIGGAVAFVVGLILSPSAPPVNKSASDHVAKAKSDPATTTTPAEAVPKVDTEQQFVSLYRAVIAKAKPCDDATNVLGKSSKSRDMLTVYQAAKDGRDVCRDATIAIGKLEPPAGLKAEGKAATDKALKTCRNAYLYRQMGMEKAMQAADGDTRPSVISEMTDNMKTGSVGTLMCVSEFFAAASSSGLDADELQI